MWILKDFAGHFTGLKRPWQTALARRASEQAEKAKNKIRVSVESLEYRFAMAFWNLENDWPADLEGLRRHHQQPKCCYLMWSQPQRTQMTLHLARLRPGPGAMGGIPVGLLKDKSKSPHWIQDAAGNHIDWMLWSYESYVKLSAVRPCRG